MGLFSSIAATASGLAAQRTRMDVVSSNVANMNSTRSATGEGPYKRQVVRMAASNAQTPFAGLVKGFEAQSAPGVVLTQVTTDESDPRRVFEPSHPDADADGYVSMPNVDLIQEMTDLTSANRSYQANATVLSALKEMALRALDIASR